MIAVIFVRGIWYRPVCDCSIMPKISFSAASRHSVNSFSITQSIATGYQFFKVVDWVAGTIRGAQLLKLLLFRKNLHPAPICSAEAVLSVIACSAHGYC